jgi:UDP-GlcNAc:undecaprenyl-phosphate GlcNAc-1-phosphate transferase
MTTLFFVLEVGLVAGLVFTPVARSLAARLGLVDRPDGRRKVHARVTPLAGGPALLAASALAVGAAFALPGPVREQLQSECSRLVGLALAGGLICALGVADGYGWLRGRHKLLGQVVAVSVVIYFGGKVQEVRLLGWHVELGLLALPFTVCWLLGTINSLNLLDGMDGLLSSVAGILCLGLAATAVLDERWAVACLALALAGAVLGFLRHNFPPASTFLGDSGSMLLGLVIGSLALWGSAVRPAAPARPVPLAVPLALLTVPFLDTAAAVLRRKLTGRSVYTTDRGHLHHCLQRYGLSHHGVLLCVASCCVVAVGGAVVSVALGHDLPALLAAGAVVATLVGMRLFGHAEFVLLGKRLRELALSLVQRPGAPRQREVRLQGSADWAELWANLRARTNRLGLKMLRLNVNVPALHEGYHAYWSAPHQESEESLLWRAEIPLEVTGRRLGRLEVVGERDHEPVLQKIMTVLEVVARFEAAAGELIGMPQPPPPAPAPVPPKSRRLPRLHTNGTVPQGT